MRFVLWLTVWLRRLVVLAILFLVALALPVAYVEFACNGRTDRSSYTSLLPSEHQHQEGQSYMAYPQEHIINAYGEYAAVVSQGDPHNYGFFSAVKGFWGSTCELKKKAVARGGFSSETKNQIYVGGVAFTADMVLKGLYEGTIGRLVTMVRGNTRSPLDNLSAQQAAEYAEFIKTSPRSEWDFGGSSSALWALNSRNTRDWERAVALNIENRMRQVTSGFMSAFMDESTPASGRRRMIVKDISPGALSTLAGINVIGNRPEGIEIEVPNDQRLSAILRQMAAQNASFVEIAGNDDILATVIAPRSTRLTSLRKFDRQGYNDTRHLVELKVWSLAERLREFDDQQILVERIYAY